VAVADPAVDAARAAASEFGVPNVFTSVDRMLAEVPSDLLVNLTSMQAHAAVSLKALRAGRHVWSEKPLATSLAAGRRLLAEARRRRRILLAAPNSPASPAFAAAARLIRSGALGKVYQIRGRYGWSGPTWSPSFYAKGGGPLPDLGVYNLTTLTGLMGPARAVAAMAGIGTPVRRMHDGARVRPTAPDNVVLLLDFGDARFGVVQTGFVGVRTDDRSTIEIIGTKGTVNFLGHDWDPKGLEVFTSGAKDWRRVATDQRGYRWERGARDLAEALADGRAPAGLPAAHALHVLEIMLATERAARTGRRVPVRSRF
jgi:predicted dehydrogenase